MTNANEIIDFFIDSSFFCFTYLSDTLIAKYKNKTAYRQTTARQGHAARTALVYLRLMATFAVFLHSEQLKEQ